VPTAQSTHSAAAAALKRPGTQGEQLGRPISFANLPASHAVHTSAPVVLYFAVAHSWHELALPTEEYLPEGQFGQYTWAALSW
jgi:hypothetical protein